MSKFKPGDIVFWMDGNVLCQSVVCVEDGRWPTVPEGYCIVYNISPDYGTRQFSHQADSSRYCDLVQAKDLYPSSDALIESIKDNLRAEYVRKLDVLDSYLKGTTKQKQSLADKVGKILLGRKVDDP